MKKLINIIKKFFAIKKFYAVRPNDTVAVIKARSYKKAEKMTANRRYVALLNERQYRRRLALEVQERLNTALADEDFGTAQLQYRILNDRYADVISMAAAKDAFNRVFGEKYGIPAFNKVVDTTVFSVSHYHSDCNKRRW